jgi:hypothetical protein
MMADDVVQVDYSGTSDSDSEPQAASESDKVDPLNWQAPSSSGIVHFAHGLSQRPSLVCRMPRRRMRTIAGPELEKNSIAVCT